VTIRVLLVDDQALLRQAFRTLLETADDLTVVGEAPDGTEALALTRELRPDVVVMDIRMPEMDGIEATRQINADETLAGVKVLVLTTFETEELVVEALRAGASGFLGKGVEPAGLINAIRTVATGESLLSPLATTAVIERFLAQAPAPVLHRDTVDALTARERELTALVAAGLSNEEIAEQLYISPATVKTHINRAMMKTHSRDRAQLVVYAYETGMVTRQWGRPGGA
jgi:DNA-binding NarL/FixJ family response regulator